MLFPSEFVKHPELSLWQPVQDGEVFAYSDGEETENYIRQAVKDVSDPSSNSGELQAKIRDWPSEYHFTPRRANLFRPLTLPKEGSVLELGCGCGALTRYFAENMGRVVAIEGSKIRAEITALRCRDLDNVEVIASNFHDVELEEKFDVVTLIGVLEYAGAYSTSKNPHLDALRLVQKKLKDGGVLILAIENKLGLKYFGGAPEDHSSLLFDGVEGYPSGRKIQTFGKQELEKLLNFAGFSAKQVMYPFPDYKLPEVVIRDFDIEEQEARGSLYQWLGFRERFEPNGITIFPNYLVAKELEANGLLDDMSNSFLVVASKSRASVEQMTGTDWYVQRFNEHRKSSFRTRTILREAQNGLRVQSQRLSAEQKFEVQSGDIKHRLVDREYFKSTSLQESILISLRYATANSFDTEPFIAHLKEWYSFLTNVSTDEGKTIPPSYVDCTPWNLLHLQDDALFYIDDEWHTEKPVEIDHVLIRGFLGIHTQCLPWLKAANIPVQTRQQFIDFCLEALELQWTPQQLESALRQEWNFQTTVLTVKPPAFETWLKQMQDNHEGGYPVARTLKDTAADLAGFARRLDETTDALRASEQELSAINRSRIWKIRNVYSKVRSLTGH